MQIVMFHYRHFLLLTWILNIPKVLLKNTKRSIGRDGLWTRAHKYHYDSIINWMKRRHHFYVKIEWIVDGNGVVPAIFY